MSVAFNHAALPAPTWTEAGACAVGTRQELLAHLAAAVRGDAELSLLAIFALEGLRDFDSLHGGSARAELVEQLGSRLARTIGRKGRCFQPRADEFAVVIATTIADALPLLRPIATVLCHHDRHAPISVAFGAAVLPDEADDPVAALRIADRRLASNAPRRKPRRRTIYHWNA